MKIKTFLVAFLCVGLSLITTQTQADPGASSTDAYTVIHAAETRVVNAEGVCRADKAAQEQAAKDLSALTNNEAGSLAKANDANEVITGVAQRMYIESDINKISLVVDFSERGLDAVADQQQFTKLNNEVSTKVIKDSLGTNAQATAATDATLKALDNYRSKTEELNKALAECQIALDNFHSLSDSTGRVFQGILVKSGFTTGSQVFLGSNVAVSRALTFIGEPSLACSDGTCFMLCDHLAGEAWGYANSGYQTAREHWAIMVATSHAHPGDIHPPLGALLFWDTGLYGHVATYVGDGMIVTNMYGSRGYGVYEIPASDISKIWGAPYLGWTDPVFAGEKV